MAIIFLMMVMRKDFKRWHKLKKFGKQPEQQSEGQEVTTSPSDTSRKPKNTALGRNWQQLREILCSKLKNEEKKEN